MRTWRRENGWQPGHEHKQCTSRSQHGSGPSGGDNRPTSGGRLKHSQVIGQGRRGAQLAAGHGRSVLTPPLHQHRHHCHHHHHHHHHPHQSPIHQCLVDQHHKHHQQSLVDNSNAPSHGHTPTHRSAPPDDRLTPTIVLHWQSSRARSCSRSVLQKRYHLRVRHPQCTPAWVTNVVASGVHPGG